MQGCIRSNLSGIPYIENYLDKLASIDDEQGASSEIINFLNMAQTYNVIQFVLGTQNRPLEVRFFLKMI